MAENKLDLSDLLGESGLEFDINVSIPLARPHEAEADLNLSKAGAEPRTPSRDCRIDAVEEAVREFVVSREEEARADEREHGLRRQEQPSAGGCRSQYQKAGPPRTRAARFQVALETPPRSRGRPWCQAL